MLAVDQDNGRIVGFINALSDGILSAYIPLLEVIQEYQGRGIGKEMLAYVEAYCRNKKIRYMTVKTLSEKSPDENYRKTRDFYLRNGFQPFEEFPTLWGEANPCLYMIKEIQEENVGA